MRKVLSVEHFVLDGMVWPSHPEGEDTSVKAKSGFKRLPSAHTKKSRAGAPFWPVAQALCPFCTFAQASYRPVAAS